jgi:hypothetical protein
LTTSARRAAIDSVDFAALDLFVGAIGGEIGLYGCYTVYTTFRFRYLPRS